MTIHYENHPFVMDSKGGIVRSYVMHECCKATIHHKAEYRDGQLFHTCKEHGEVILVPVYEPKETPTTKEVKLFCYWACPMCIVDEYGDLVEVEAKVCVTCYDKYNLVDCSFCKKKVCPKHHAAGVCFDCIAEQTIRDIN